MEESYLNFQISHRDLDTNNVSVYPVMNVSNDKSAHLVQINTQFRPPGSLGIRKGFILKTYYDEIRGLRGVGFKSIVTSQNVTNHNDYGYHYGVLYLKNFPSEKFRYCFSII